MLWWALDLPLACQGWSTGRDRCPGAGWSSALPIRGGSDGLASKPDCVPSPFAPGSAWGRGGSYQVRDLPSVVALPVGPAGVHGGASWG